MTESSRRDRRSDRAGRQRTQAMVVGGIALVVVAAVIVFLVVFRGDDSPATKASGTTTTTATAATTAPASTAPPSSAAPDTTAPSPTTPPPVAGAPAENVSASGSGCGGDDQPAVAGTWEATAPRAPVSGGDVDLALRQQDGPSVAGLPVTAVVTAPGGKTFVANPVPVAAIKADAKVAFPKDFPTADRFRLDNNPGLYPVRWQTVAGSSLACAGFQVA